MKIKQKNIYRKKIIVAVMLAILTVTGTGGTIFALQGSSQTTAETRDNKAIESMFSFSDPQGWWQGVTTKTSMVVFDNNSSHACFVMLEYISGSVDADSEINKINAELTKHGENYAITPLDTKKLELHTTAGPVGYELRQSSVTTPPGSSKVKGGQAFGYIQLSDGYVEIKGYCDTPEQLGSIMPALEAIKFDDTN